MNRVHFKERAFNAFNNFNQVGPIFGTCLVLITKQLFCEFQCAPNFQFCDGYAHVNRYIIEEHTYIIYSPMYYKIWPKIRQAKFCSQSFLKMIIIIFYDCCATIPRF